MLFLFHYHNQMMMMKENNIIVLTILLLKIFIMLREIMLTKKTYFEPSLALLGIKSLDMSLVDDK